VIGQGNDEGMNSPQDLWKGRGIVKTCVLEELRKSGVSC
jgi:hypothetical protein